MAKTVTKWLLALVELIRELVVKLVLWVFNYFSGANGFLPDTTWTSFKGLFNYGGTNVFSVLINSVILPVSLGLVVILLSYTLYKSILSDRAAESPGKIVGRSLLAVVLIIGSITIFSIPLTVGSTVHGWINDAMSNTTMGTMDNDSFTNLETMAENILGGEEVVENDEKLVSSKFFSAYEALGGSGTVSAEDIAKNMTIGVASHSITFTADSVLQRFDKDGDGMIGESDYNAEKTRIDNSVSAVTGNVLSIGVGLMSIAVGVWLAWRYAKLVVQYLSRYVRLCLLIIFSPLASATLASAGTADIFSAYARMFAGSLVSLLISQALILAMKFACAVTLNAETLNGMVVYFCMTLAYAQFAENVDAYVSQVKLGTPKVETPKAMGEIGRAIFQRGVSQPIGAVLGAPSHALGGMVGTAGKGVGKVVGGAVGAATGATIGKAVGKAGEKAVGMATGVKAGKMLGAAASLGGAISMKDKGAVTKAQTSAQNLAKSTVLGMNAGGGVASKMTQANGKFAVDAMRGTHASVSGAMGAVSDVTKATLQGVNGSTYEVSKVSGKDGDGFKITDKTSGAYVSTNAGTWDSALDSVARAGGGLSGVSQFNTSTGDVYNTTKSTSGEIALTQQIGRFDDRSDAIASMTGDTFNIQNDLGFSGNAVRGEVARMMDSAETTGLEFTMENGAKVAGSMNAAGELTVQDKHGKTLEYSGLSAFGNANRNVKSVEFFGNLDS